MKFRLVIPLVVVISGLAFSNSRWWNLCSKHWNECQKLYMDWKGQKVKFSQQELQCVENSKSATEMLSCLSKVKAEKRSYLRKWKSKLRKSYIKWLREDKLQHSDYKKSISQKGFWNNNSTKVEKLNLYQK